MKIRILIIDDDGTLTVLKDRLNVTNFFHAEIEEYGIEGVAHAIEFKPDLIIVDYQLDKDRLDGGILTDGNVVIEQLKKEPGFKNVPIIRCSRWFSDDDNRLFEEENLDRLIFAFRVRVGSEFELLAKIANIFFHVSKI